MAQNSPLDRLSLFGREKKQCDQEEVPWIVLHLL